MSPSPKEVRLEGDQLLRSCPRCCQNPAALTHLLDTPSTQLGPPGSVIGSCLTPVALPGLSHQTGSGSEVIPLSLPLPGSCQGFWHLGQSNLTKLDVVQSKRLHLAALSENAWFAFRIPVSLGFWAQHRQLSTPHTARRFFPLQSILAPKKINT